MIKKRIAALMVFFAAVFGMAVFLSESYSASTGTESIQAFRDIPLAVISTCLLALLAILLLFFVRNIRLTKNAVTHVNEIAEARQNLQSLLDMLPVGVRILSIEDFTLLYSNEACLKVFGCTSFEEQVRGQSGFGFMPEYQPDGRKTADLVDEFARAGAFVAEMQCLKLNREPFTCRITTSCTIHYNGHRASLAIMEDVTAEEEYRRILKETAIKEQEANHLKSRFLANMSHEIRTPINAIMGMHELALRESEIKVKNEHIFTAKQAALNLLTIINDILDFSKIEAGKMEIVPENYEVASLLNDLVSMIRTRMIDSQVHFTVKVDRNIPQTLYGDETRLRQAVLNILNNAVKYTEKGFVSFSVHGEFQDDDTVNITFEITDTGIGIKKEDTDKLFDDFTQFDLEKNRGVEGVGLGLAITHSIIKAMDGLISVNSEYGTGSTFTVTLPQKYHSRKELAAVLDADEKNIMIYERREAYAESIAWSLDNLHVDYTFIKSGTDLYEKMETKPCDYLFISYELYERNEETILKFGKDTKTVLLSEFCETIYEKNVNVLALPVYCLQLADILNGSGDAFSYTADNGHIVSFLAPDARVLIVDDIMTNLKVTQGLLAPYNMRVDLCDNGMSAIEAVRTTRYDLVFMDHKMPGMDGVEATRRIRDMAENDLYYKNIPIIALTANAVSGVMDMFLDNGFNDFLSKPIDTLKLDIILEKWLPKNKQEREL
ncbi:MAG: ATP-binding protein [Oscillospiraceae bacterium]|nr:ATP-binding protein [Oscillospiraceae bacterium]